MNTSTDPAPDLLTLTRATLARMAFKTALVYRTVRADVRELLIERGLMVEMTDGYLDATVRGEGIYREPSLFIL